MTQRGDQVSTQELEQTLRVLAKLVASNGGGDYVPLFVRIEDELKARRASSDARSRARALLQQEQAI
ncbi:conserved hypothetical protein [Hyphomicrobium denitrificans ATCC 51888]|uniref:Uncharacterized protein n=1 Tax=Hyphomicrobium denitrificans (strain ATCC 51888 / DSM 1869 / NCIMB 11706 / TK 0415) TaxID=582899 RepID=D8JVU4_HYPDA|nr:conserved hypothetical protein [Hyphomicrobium denitrificans ATCC 51888]